MVQKTQMDVINRRGLSHLKILSGFYTIVLLFLAMSTSYGQRVERQTHEGQSADSAREGSSNIVERVGIRETIRLVEDRATTLEIPGIIDMVSSAFHLYVMSESDGLVVFRKKEEGLTWLYSATGMQRRGSTLFADDRFAYVKGQRNQLSVLEPTSVLGVYSSTRFASAFSSVARTHHTLWIAFPDLGIGKLSLETPEQVDMEPEFAFLEQTQGCQVKDVVSDGYAHLFALVTCIDSDSTSKIIHILDPPSGEETASIESIVDIEGDFQSLHWVRSMGLFASGSEGLVSISEEGSTFFWVQVEDELSDVHAIGSRLILRTKSGLLWAGSLTEGFQQVRSDVGGGNFITQASSGLFLAQYDRLQNASLEIEQEERLIAFDRASAENSTNSSLSTETSNPSTNQGFSLFPIPSITVPLPQSVILPISYTTASSTQAVQLTLLSNIEAAQIRGRSFLWTPSSNDVGEHTFTVLATTTDGRVQTQEFTINVRPFNAPPRFAPNRAMTVPTGELFTTQFFAVDPDGLDAELLDYRAEDLPRGARLDRKTGVFEWTPTEEQIGVVIFQVFARDQYGTASVQDVELRVRSIAAGEESSDQDGS